MNNHTKAARAHFAFAILYATPPMVLLAVAALTGSQPDARLPALAAFLATAHGVIGWGAWRAKNWARVSTLALALPALLAVPLGTLVAIQLISYCWQAWHGARPALSGLRAAR